LTDEALIAPPDPEMPSTVMVSPGRIELRLTERSFFRLLAEVRSTLIVVPEVVFR
jgi:hypothetical protein